MEQLILQTQAKLQPLFQKPKLTDKLLARPPFRFLHDIVTNLLQSTNFPAGLFIETDLNSDNVQDKQAKIVFLEKLINVVGICLGCVPDVRAAKIVAGLEPENTCQFLQLLADAASDAQVDVAQAVSRVLRGEIAGQGEAARKHVTAPSVPVVNHAQEKLGYSVESSSSLSSSKLVEQEAIIPPLVAAASSDRGASRGGRRSNNVVSANEFGGGVDNNSSVSSQAKMSMNDPVSNPAASDSKHSSSALAAESSLDSLIEKCTGSDINMTMELLQSVISRPKLTEKLLSRPPFRFLHDIVTEVISCTGFARGLYNDDELDSSKLVEKEDKIAFLEKIVRLVGTQLNTLMDVRAVKVVAGLEPETTNRFLQLLTLAAKHLPDSTRNVSMIASEQQLPINKMLLLKDDDINSNAKVTSNGVSSSHDTAAAMQSAQDEFKAKIHSITPTPSREPSPKIYYNNASSSNENATNETGGGVVSADSDEKKSTRPSTARRRPPKVVNPTILPILDGSAASKQTSLDGSGGKTSEVATNVIRLVKDTGKTGDDEDGDDYDGGGAKSGSKQSTSSSSSYSLDQIGDLNSRGKLVRDIVNEQSSSQQQSTTDDKTKMDVAPSTVNSIRMGRVWKADSINGKKNSLSGGAVDLTDLRSGIQTLVQSTTPLAACMDHVLDDVSGMSTEHRHWQEQVVKLISDLETERKITKDSLLPWNRQVVECDEEVARLTNLVSAIKSRIKKHDVEVDRRLRVNCEAK